MRPLVLAKIQSCCLSPLDETEAGRIAAKASNMSAKEEARKEDATQVEDDDEPDEW